MKILESAPERYDKGINLLSLGNNRQIQQKIVEGYVSAGDEVLEIGCGTGTLAVSCALKGASVVGFDVSAQMLALARRKVSKYDLLNKVQLLEMGAIEMDKTFGDETFDKIVSTLVLSELYPEERKYVLRQGHRILRSGGLLIIADELRSDLPWKRVLQSIIRIPLSVTTYIFTQTTTRALKEIGQEINAAGFKVVHEEKRFLDSFGLYVAKKV